jgi:3-methyladenine DNA glycosylase AlkD
MQMFLLFTGCLAAVIILLNNSWIRTKTGVVACYASFLALFRTNGYFRFRYTGKMTAEEVLKELSALGSEQTKKIFARHGAPEPLYGVKVEDLKKLQKKIKKDQQLAMALYETGNSDAMYLAGLIADGSRMSPEELQSWADKASWYMISEYTVAWVASESPYGLELARKWIDSPREQTACAGWAVLSALAAITDDTELDAALLESLIERVEKEIHTAANRVRYTMNGFVISVGGYVRPLRDRALAAAGKIGKVSVDMGGTACKVPPAAEYILKMEAMGRAGKKRKTVRC